MELVNFPLALPGTKVYKAIQARKVVMHWFMHCSAESKKKMARGEEPECLVDEWIKAMQDARRSDEVGDDNEKALLNREYSDHEIAMVLLSFLFASQGESRQFLPNFNDQHY
jgi:C-22 sterol desaturase